MTLSADLERIKLLLILLEGAPVLPANKAKQQAWVLHSLGCAPVNSGVKIEPSVVSTHAPY